MKPTLPKNEQAEPNDPTTAELLAMLIEMRKGDQKLQAESLRQTRSKNNARSPEISVFNPRGEKDFPTPPLAFDVLMPWTLAKGPSGNNGLTREEIQLLNLVTPGEYLLDLLDGSTVQCCVIGTKNVLSGKLERLAFMGARDEDSHQYSTLFNKERRNAFPALVALLHQILVQRGVDVSEILTMKEENRRIRLPEDNPQHLSVSVGE